MSKKYKVIGMGGTFDRLHAGHQQFLRFASDLSDEIWVGIATDIFTKNKPLANIIEDFETRSIHVTQFLQQQGIQARIFPLSDPCGPTLQGSPVEAIVVTNLTKAGGDFINQCRTNIQLPLLPIEVCELLKDEQGEHLSSTRIREGKINRQGRVYSLLLDQGLILDSNQKQFFREKRGQLITAPMSPGIYSFIVGDMVLATFIQNQWPYHLGVFDGFNQRQLYNAELLQSITPDATAPNSAGQITKVLYKNLENLQQQLLSTQIDSTFKPLHFKVQGEEDLAAVVLALIAPLESTVYYGQPNEGMIEMRVTEQLKEQFYGALQTFQAMKQPGLTSLSEVTGA